MFETVYTQWGDMPMFVKNSENLSERFLKNRSKTVFLYGGGIAGGWYMKWFEANGVKVNAVIESNPDRWIQKGIMPFGLPVISLDDAIRDRDDYSIVIGAPKYMNEINSILSAKCPEDRIFSFEAEIYYSFIHNIEAYRNFLLDNWSRVERLYEWLEDDLSKKTLQAFIQGRVSGNQKYFSDIMVEDQYYSRDIISFGDDEVFVECGANNGNTMMQFINIVNRKYRSLYVFEPDRNCINMINDLVADKDISNLKLIKKAAWDIETELSFASSSDDGSSHLSKDKADYNVNTGIINNEVDIPPTYIKMDIEGAELNALKGGDKLITSYKPTLAICIYHNPEDFLNISEYIKQLVPEYRLYMRHHNWAATETVLYAIAS